MKKILFALYIYTPDFEDGVVDEIRRVYENKEDALKFKNALDNRYHIELVDDYELGTEYYDLKDRYFREDLVYNEAIDRVDVVYNKYLSVDKDFLRNNGELYDIYYEETKEDQDRIDELEKNGYISFVINNAKNPEIMKNYITAKESSYRGSRIEIIKLY